MSNNPAARDMVLRVEFDEELLLDLFRVREAWRLEVVGPGVPPRPLELSEPELTAEVLRSDEGDWERAWMDLWEATSSGVEQE